MAESPFLQNSLKPSPLSPFYPHHYLPGASATLPLPSDSRRSPWWPFPPQVRPPPYASATVGAVALAPPRRAWHGGMGAAHRPGPAGALALAGGGRRWPGCRRRRPCPRLLWFRREVEEGKEGGERELRWGPLDSQIGSQPPGPFSLSGSVLQIIRFPYSENVFQKVRLRFKLRRPKGLFCGRSLVKADPIDFCLTNERPYLLNRDSDRGETNAHFFISSSSSSWCHSHTVLTQWK